MCTVQTAANLILKFYKSVGPAFFEEMDFDQSIMYLHNLLIHIIINSFPFLSQLLISL